MKCPITSEIWQYYQETEDPQVAAHLAVCASCRRRSEEFACLQNVLASLAPVDVPDTVSERALALAATTEDQALDCQETLALLDAWIDGELDKTRAFLVEDHLLWCAPCAEAFGKAETLATALRQTPMLEAPAVIAERIADARIPWWQRVLPAPAPNWTRSASLAASLAAGFMLVVGLTLFQPRAGHTPTSTLATQPVHNHQNIATDEGMPTASALPPAVVITPSVNHPARTVVHAHGGGHRHHRATIAIPSPPDTPVVATVPDTTTVTKAQATPSAMATIPDTKTTDAAKTVVASLPVSKPVDSPEEYMTSRLADERLAKIDNQNAEYSEKIRPGAGHVRLTSMSSTFD